MKKRIFFVATLLIAIAVGMLFWLRLKREAAKLESKPAIVERAEGPSTGQFPTALPVNQTTPAIKPPYAKQPPEEQRRETINAWEQAREKDVEFWGKILDQHNEPVVGAEVTATVTTHQIPAPGLKPQPTPIYSATTDADGIFYIKSRAGRGFTIETLRKSGYVLNPELQKRSGNLYWYNYDQLDPKGFKPDHSAPVIFRMWRSVGSGRLVEQYVRTAIPYDGTPVTYDLLTGHETRNGGDLRVILMRNPQQIRWGQRNYEWIATVESIDGGLVESTDEFMYLAPEVGYQSKIVVHMNANDPQWTDEKVVAFYLKSRGGENYGRVELKFMVGSDKKETGLNYHSFINPSGSRNLEYDPAAQSQNLIKSRLNPPASAPASKL